MPITISGSSGIAGANGSVTVPAYAGGTPNTGIYFPLANTVAITAGGTEVLRSNTSGNFATSMNVVTMNVTTMNVLSMNVTTMNVISMNVLSITSPSLASVSGGNTGDIVIGLTASKTGYLACDGSIYTRSSYYPLANSIGTPYSYSIVRANTMATTYPGLIHEANGVLYRTGSILNGSATVAQPGGLMTSTDGVSWNYVTGLPIITGGGITGFYGGYGNMAVYGNNFTVLGGSGWANNSTTVYYQYGVGSNTTGPFNVVSYSPAGYNSYYPLIHDIAYGTSSNRFVTICSGFLQSGCVQVTSYAHIYYMGNPSTPTLGTTITYAGASGTPLYNHVAGSPNEFLASTYLYNGTGGNFVVVLRSTDGATWGNVSANVVAALSNQTDYIMGVSYSQHAGKFLAVSSSGQILQSSNGANFTWTSAATNTPARRKIRTAYTANGGSIIYYSNDSQSTAPGNTIFSTDLVNWNYIPVSSLAPAMTTFTSVAMPNNSVRIYGESVSGTSWGVGANSASYYADLYNYNTTTQFPVPYLTFNTGGMAQAGRSNNSPVGFNTIPINYFVKT